MLEVVKTKSEAWLSSLQQAGFSEVAASSMGAMTKVTLEQNYELPETPILGATTLQECIAALVKRMK